jgi:2-phosphosulfolactate phosphatase
VSSTRGPGRIEVLFTPAEFSALKDRDLRDTDCVVIDVLRATSSMVTALENGASGIMAVSEIAEAMAAGERDRGILLAGEREGLRIESGLTNGRAFDLGNSPREFTPEVVRGKLIVMTTTNGTRALRACAAARVVIVASFLNLDASAGHLRQLQSSNLLIVCGGTFEEAAYEDILCGGALVESLRWDRKYELVDSAVAAERLYQGEKDDLIAALSRSRNGRRLLERPELKDDVSFCAQRDCSDVVARLDNDKCIRRVTSAS